MQQRKDRIIAAISQQEWHLNKLVIAAGTTLRQGDLAAQKSLRQKYCFGTQITAAKG